MEYYNKVNALCESAGISIASLERDLEIGNGTIGKWREPKKDGRFPSPSIPTLKKIANYFGVSITYFTEG